MLRFSIFGSLGFVGSNLVRYLRRQGYLVEPFTRETMPPAGAQLGHTVYCVGLTADFRTRLTDTVRAHVTVLADVLDRYSFDSLLYLSSTRVYAGAPEGREDTTLLVQSGRVDQVYNLSKLTGESLCLARPEHTFRVIRLSNVIGPGMAPTNFLPSVVDEARRNGSVLFRTAPQSTKDYIDIDDVCVAIEAIATAGGNARLYNVASGVAVTNQTIALLIQRYLHAKSSFLTDGETVRYPPIDVSRLRAEFDFEPTPFEVSFRKMIQSPVELESPPGAS